MASTALIPALGTTTRSKSPGKAPTVELDCGYWSDFVCVFDHERRGIVRIVKQNGGLAAAIYGSGRQQFL
jgi:hypothetical protein